jgi:hypothetical protein
MQATIYILNGVARCVNFLNDFYLEFTRNSLCYFKLSIAIDAVLLKESNNTFQINNCNKILLYTILMDPTKVSNYELLHLNFYDVLNQKNLQIKIKSNL